MKHFLLTVLFDLGDKSLMVHSLLRETDILSTVTGQLTSEIQNNPLMEANYTTAIELQIKPLLESF